MDAPRDDRSLGDLLGQLSGQVGTLVRKEVELARTEMQANAMKAARDAAFIGIGGVVAHAGFLVLVGGVVLLLGALGLELWIAALLVGAGLVAGGAVLVQRGREQLAAGSIAPTRTIETLKEDAEWAKEQTQ